MIIIEPPSTPTNPRPPLNKRDLQQFLAQAKKAVPLRGVVTVLLTTDQAVRELNHRFRHRNEATDVLSFPSADLDGASNNARPPKIVGDLAISLETATRQAQAYGHDLSLEIKILILHGLLHLSGLDHEADSGEMARREQELRNQLDLPLGLIQRTTTTRKRRTAR